MSSDRYDNAAEAILALINVSPRTPGKADIAALVRKHAEPASFPPEAYVNMASPVFSGDWMRAGRPDGSCTFRNNARQNQANTRHPDVLAEMIASVHGLQRTVRSAGCLAGVRVVQLDEDDLRALNSAIEQSPRVSRCAASSSLLPRERRRHPGRQGSSAGQR